MMAKLMGALWVPLVARLLGTVDFGRYTTLTSYYLLANALADPGHSVIMIRDVATSEDSKHGELLGTGLALRGALSLVTTVLFFVTLLLNGFPYVSILLILLSHVISGLFGALTSFLRATNRVHIEAGFTLASRIVSIGLGITALFWGAGVNGLLAAQTISLLLILAVALVLVVRVVHSMQVNWAVALRQVRVGWPLGLASVLTLVYFKIDMIMLSWMTTPTDVGEYAAAYKILETLALLASSVPVVLFPVLSRASKDRFILLLHQGLLLLFAVSAPIAVGGVFTSEGLVRFIFGASYSRSAADLVVLLWCIPFIFINGLLGQAAIAVGRNRVPAIASGVCALVNISVNLVLIPRMGSYGAAWATLITEFVLLSLHYYYLRDFLRFIQFATEAFRVGLGCLAVAACAWVWHGHHVVAAIALSAAVYLLSLICLRVKVWTYFREIAG